MKSLFIIAVIGAVIFITIVLILLLFAFVSLIFAKIKYNYDKEEFSCQVVKKVYLGEYQKEIKKQNMRAILFMFLHPFQYFSLMTVISALKKGRIDKSITLFEQLTTKDNVYVSKVASSFLSMLYAHKSDDKKALYWHHQLAFHSSLVQYELALIYSRVCEEETKEAGTEIYWQGNLFKMKKIFPKLNIQAYIDFFNNRDNFPKDCVQAYFWANLAVKNNFPTAKGLKELIAEKMTPEELEKASNFSY